MSSAAVTVTGVPGVADVPHGPDARDVYGFSGHFPAVSTLCAHSDASKYKFSSPKQPSRFLVRSNHGRQLGVNGNYITASASGMLTTRTVLVYLARGTKCRYLHDGASSANHVASCWASDSLFDRTRYLM